MRITDWLRARLLGHVIDTPVGNIQESLDELRKTEWSDEFEQLMRNRLLVGCFRYGRMSDPNKGKYDHVESIRERLKLYEQSGNLEHLVDVANFSLVEFVHPRHPNAHFEATDDVIHAQAKTPRD